MLQRNRIKQVFVVEILVDLVEFPDKRHVFEAESESDVRICGCELKTQVCTSWMS